MYISNIYIYIYVCVYLNISIYLSIYLSPPKKMKSIEIHFFSRTFGHAALPIHPIAMPAPPPLAASRRGVPAPGTGALGTAAALCTRIGAGAPGTTWEFASVPSGYLT